MAKLTFDEFKSILDYIEQRQPDSYSSLYLYVKEYTEKATVFKHPITDEEVRSVVDAIVIQESVQLVDSDHIYRLPVIRDSSWVGSGSKPKDAVNVYDRFIAGYTNAEDIMNTICRAYGVILSESFKYEAPDDYNKILRLIAGFYNNAEDVANQPFGAKKYGDEYLSYFPVYIVYEIGKYLSNLGVFEKDAVNTQPLMKYGTPNTDTPLFTSESSFRRNVVNKVTDLYTGSYAADGEQIKSMYNLISSLLDYNKFIVMFISTSYLDIYELPNNIILPHNNMNTGRIPISAKTGIFSRNYLYFYSRENFSYTKYTVSFSSLSYSKSVREVNENSVVSVNHQGYYVLTNIDYLAQPILYNYRFYIGTQESSYKSSIPVNDLGRFPGISSGDLAYFELIRNLNNSDLKKLSSSDLYKVLSLDSDEYKLLLEHFGLSFDENCLVFITTIYSSASPYKLKYMKIFVIEDLHTFSTGIENTELSDYVLSPKFSLDFTKSNIEYLVAMSGSASSHEFNTPLSNTRTKKPSFIESSDSFKVYEFSLKIEDDAYTYSSNVTESTHFQFLLDDSYLSSTGIPYKAFSNIGELKYIEPKPDWYELESGATLPTAISTIQDLSATYPDWIAKSVRIHSPYYEGSLNEEALTGLATVDFVPLSVSGANSQSEAQAGLIDVDNFDIVLEQIEDAEEDINPEEDPDVDPNDDPPNTNVGDTPDLPDLDDLPNLANIGLLHMYQMSEGQLRTFANVLLDPLSTVEKFFNNPFDAIISLQAAPIFNASGVSTDLIFNGFTFAGCQGQLIINNNVDGDFGEVDLSPYFNNYIDYTDTEIELYLPFVGYVSIDVDKFINGKIHLKCRVDNLTGSIVYFVYSIRDGSTQLLYTFDGNCQSQVPVTSSDYSRLFAGLFGMATGAIAGAANVANYIDPVNTMARHVARKNLEYEMSPNIVELNMRERAVRDMQRGVDLVNNPIAKQLFGGD